MTVMLTMLMTLVTRVATRGVLLTRSLGGTAFTRVSLVKFWTTIRQARDLCPSPADLVRHVGTVVRIEDR